MPISLWVLVLLTVACPQILLAQSDTTRFPQTPEIRLGAALPLSGDFATYGEVIRDGMELAKEDLHHRGIEARLFFEDVPLPGPAAVTAIRKLIVENRIQGLAGNFFNPNMTIMAPLINQHRIPTFHTAIVDDKIKSLSPYVFSTNTTVERETKVLTKHIVQTFRSKRAAILYVGTQWGEAYNANLTHDFKANGIEILSSVMIPLDQRDLRAELTNIRSLDPDVLILAFFGPQLGIALNQTYDIGLRNPVVGTYETQDSAVKTITKRNGLFVSFFVPEDLADSDTRRSFKQAFLKRFGYHPPILAANAYDSTVLLSTALRSCKSDALCTLEELQSPRTVDGASGLFSMDRYATKNFVEKLLWRGTVFVRGSED